MQPLPTAMSATSQWEYRLTVGGMSAITDKHSKVKSQVMVTRSTHLLTCAFMKWWEQNKKNKMAQKVQT